MLDFEVLRVLNFVLTLALAGMIFQWGRTIYKVNRIVALLESYSNQKLKGENNNE